MAGTYVFFECCGSCLLSLDLSARLGFLSISLLVLRTSSLLFCPLVGFLCTSSLLFCPLVGFLCTSSLQFCSLVCFLSISPLFLKQLH
jgi:hypothetical protein